MMPCLEIRGAIPEGLDPFTTYQAYNVLDSAITAQLAPEIKSRMNSNHLATYTREIKVWALCLELSTKGFPVDQLPLAELLYQLEKDEAKAQRYLNKFAEAVDFPRNLNPRSPKDVADLFYHHLGLPEIYEFDRKTKQRKISTDIKALEKLRTNYPIAAPFVNAILAVREARKMASVFKGGLEPKASVLRCNFSPTGTETGRLSSQQNVYGRGTNAQNLTDRVRQVIAAPEGYAILNLDLKTAESIAVGFVSGCKAYIEACMTGDLHTAVTRMNWQLNWTGELEKDKAIAEKPYYRHFSYRDMAKRGGHLTNYYGQPRTMGMHLKLPTKACEEFQHGYFKAFPEIAEWHLRTIARIQRDGAIITQLGRERRFWGRADDAATHREAIAFEPQSLVGEVMNEGLINIQTWLLKECREAKTFLGRKGQLIPFRPEVCDMRAQVHDAGVFLIPIEALDTLAPIVQSLLLVPVDFGELGEMIIPSDMMVGKRWCKVSKDGGDRYMKEGLKPWKPGQSLHWLER